MKLAISKNNEQFKAFIVVNSEGQIKDLLECEIEQINIICLNDSSTEELIQVLSKSKYKSQMYQYVLCMANDKHCIYEMVRLMEWMKDNTFQFMFLENQLSMYQETLKDK